MYLAADTDLLRLGSLKLILVNNHTVGILEIYSNALIYVKADKRCANIS